MAVKGYLRGHAVCFDDEWFYLDNGSPVWDNQRDCGLCKQSSTDHDPCIANLPGVLNACCGHGRDREAYIMFIHETVRGKDAIRYFRSLGLGPPKDGMKWRRIKER